MPVVDEPGLVPIQKKFLNQGELFGIEFNEGFVFAEVSGWEELHHQPLDTVGSIAAGDNSGYIRLEDPDNSDDDILFIPGGKNKVIHAAIGQRPAYIRRYTEYPEDGTRLRSIPNLGPPSSRSGDDYGYVDGEKSPYEQPTDAEELLIPPDTRVNFDFFNPDPSDAHTPIVHIAMRVYDIRILRPSVDADKNAIRNIVRPGSPIPVFPAGSIDTKINFRLDTDWGIEAAAADKVDSIRRNQ